MEKWPRRDAKRRVDGDGADMYNRAQAPAAAIAYSPADDALYVKWGSEPATHGLELTPCVILRFTDGNELVGITIYDLTRLMRSG